MNELQTVGANVPDIVRQLIKSCNAMKEPSLTAFLPLLRFEGHPYNLRYHFQLEPLYRMRYPRRMVLMTARQVGKSQGLVSSTVLRCALVPNYHTLICEPQFMQIRQISNITFKNMVAQSYIANYMIGPGCNNSMLIREFTSGSRANFMYIGGGADRARGLAGIRRLQLDECLQWNTKIITIDSEGKIKIVPIKEVKEKNFVLSFDFSKTPRILISVVKKDASYRGKRACFKVTTEAGRQIVCTADHPFPTDKGAKRLSEVIEDEYLRRTSKTGRDYSITTECNHGLSIGGRECHSELKNIRVCEMESRWEAGSLCESQVHPLTRAYYETTRDETESRLRRHLVLLGNKEPWDVSLITSDVVSRGIKNKKSDRGIPVSYYTPYSVGLALDGRWKSSCSTQLWNSSYQWVPKGGCGSSPEVVNDNVGNRIQIERSCAHSKQETLLGTGLSCQGFCKTSWFNPAIYTRVDAIQMHDVYENMSCLWKDFSCDGETDNLFRGMCQSIRERNGSPILSGSHGTSQRSWEEMERRTQGGAEGKEERIYVESSRRKEGRFENQGQGEGEGKTCRSRKKRDFEKKEKGLESKNEGRSRIRGKAERGKEEVLRKDQSRSRKICKKTGNIKSMENKEWIYETWLITGRESSYSYDRIVSVEYVGEDDVYDIEVEGTHNFILADGTCSFNCNDMEIDVINIVAETMSAVKEGGTFLYTGTPVLTDGTLPYYYNQSSGGEITIKCEHCNKINIASIEYDLLKMIGKTTCICAKCGKPLDVRKSYYSFRRPELRATFDGFHLSQATHPLHCTSPVKWREFLLKMETYPESQFIQECLGEPADSSVRLITRGDLESATTGQDNDHDIALSNSRHYGQLVLGIDWGGYGIEGESFTVMAVVGLRPMERKLEVLYLEKIPTGKKHEEQVARAVSLAEEFHCTAIAHDGTGAGAIKEEMLNQEMKGEGILTVPLVYMWAPRQDALRYIEPNNGHAGYYALDKTRSLALTIGAIKAKQLLLPNYKSCSSLLDDFLALGEDIRSTQNSGEIRIITRMGTHPDDTAHAINLAANALWHMNKCRPDLGSMVNKYENQPDWASEGSELQL